MPRKKARERAIPVGLFILIGMLILIIGIVWVRNIQLRPGYSFIVAFNNPDRVHSGVAVYYRGIQVGRVTDVWLDQELDSTLVKIGIRDADLELPLNSEVHVRLEGITGVRYIEVRPPVQPAVAYIEDGDLLRGEDSLTMDRLMAQLDRIAEERIIERLLVSSQEAMENIAVAAVDVREFVGQNREPANEAISQFNRTARAVELASRDFQGVMEPTREAVPRITASIDQFVQRTEGMDEAILAFRDASTQIGGAAESFDRQMIDANLIPELAGTVRSVRFGVQDAVGAFRGTAERFGETAGQLGVTAEQFGRTAEVVRGVTGEVETGVIGVREALSGELAEVQEMRRLSDTLEQAGQTLEQQARALSPELLEQPHLQRDARRLTSLTRDIQARTRILQDLLESPPDRQEAAQLHRQLRELQDLSGEATRLIDRLEPGLRQTLAEETREYRDEMIPPDVLAASRMLASLETLGEASRQLTGRVGTVQRELSGEAPARPGGLLGGFGQTLQQFRQTAARYDCLAAQISDMLGTRFLGFRLFFGAPGADIQCDTPEDLRQYSLLERQNGPVQP